MSTAAVPARPKSFLLAALILGGLGLSSCLLYGTNTMRGSSMFTQTLSFDCLDVGIGIANANLTSVPVHPVLAVGLGNRCDRPIWVELRGIRTLATLRNGTEVEMSLIDPDREITRALLDVEAFGLEYLRFELPEAPSPDELHPIKRLCVDPGSVETGYAAPVPARMICIEPEYATQTPGAAP